MPFANNGDVRLNYEVVGGGPDIVLIHANPFDRRLWRFQVKDFPFDNHLHHIRFYVYIFAVVHAVALQ